MAQTIYDIPVTRIDGTPTNLGEFEGKVLLVVNVASKCGLTPQYEGLERLHEALCERGFSVLGFPANDFAGQEPGSDSEIQAFCTGSFGVQFPMFSKITVTGADKHPLYAHLTAGMPQTPGRSAMETQLRKYGMEPTPEPEVLWNFEKFLVDRQGSVVARFSPDTAPDSPQIREAVEAALARA